MNHYGVAGFDLPALDATDKLQRVLASALESQLGKHWTQVPGEQPLYWNPTYFDLPQVSIFREASPEEQVAITAIANQGLLEEAYFVEKAGVGYMAKMVLLAETTEERMLYSLFAADEATHLAQVRGFLPQEPVNTGDSFLRFLADLAESQDKAVLLFTLQVVLEGWGLSHYRSLARDCQDPALKQLFEGFVEAEARHHGTGRTLFNQMSLSTSSRDTLTEVLTLFLRMVQAGPQRVVGAIAQVKGDLSRQQRVRIFEELETETHSAMRLQYLRSLMQGSASESIIQTLEEQGAFQPFPAEKCV